MRVFFNISFWTMVVTIATNVSMLKAVERSSVWSFPELLLRALLVAQLTCLSAWFCQRRLPAAFQAVGMIAVVILGVLAANLPDAAQAQLWFACLLVHLASVNLTFGTLTKLQAVVSGYRRLPGRFALSSALTHEKDKRVDGSASQFTIRDLLSLTVAAGLIFAAIVRSHVDQQSLLIILAIFGCSGLLSALNIWSSLRFERSTATTIAILISAVGGGLLKLCALSNQYWLTATLLFILLQLSICCGILMWHAIARSIAQPAAT